MKTHIIVITILIALLSNSCEDNNDKKDNELPVIDMSGPDASPISCDTLFRGETFVFQATFTDQVELGSYSLDIHHNFDLHNPHTGEIGECPPEPEKEPLNPFVLQRSFSIPEGLQSFEATNEITVPDDVDEGDYHFTVKLTDQNGWQATYAVSVKIKDRG